MPKDVVLALMLLGGCGPLLAGYFLMVIRSKARFRVSSWPVFILMFLGSMTVLGIRLYLTNNGLEDANGKIPELGEVGPLGYALFALTGLVLAWNAGNWNNPDLKGNYITSFMFDRKMVGWYVLALALQPLISVISYLGGQVLGMPLEGEMIKLSPEWTVGLLSTFFFFGGNEEFGWRGFMQTELQKKYSPLITVLIVSFFWSLWHLPHYYNGFYSTGGFMDLLPRFIWLIPLTIVIHWVYNNSNYSMLAVVLLHAMNNNYGKAFGSSGRVFLGIIGLLCLFMIVRDKMWKRIPKS